MGTFLMQVDESVAWFKSKVYDTRCIGKQHQFVHFNQKLPHVHVPRLNNWLHQLVCSTESNRHDFQAEGPRGTVVGPGPTRKMLRLPQR